MKITRKIETPKHMLVSPWSLFPTTSVEGLWKSACEKILDEFDPED